MGAICVALPLRECAQAALFSSFGPAQVKSALEDLNQLALRRSSGQFGASLAKPIGLAANEHLSHARFGVEAAFVGGAGPSLASVAA